MFATYHNEQQQSTRCCKAHNYRLRYAFFIPQR